MQATKTKWTHRTVCHPHVPMPRLGHPVIDVTTGQPRQVLRVVGVSAVHKDPGGDYVELICANNIGPWEMLTADEQSWAWHALCHVTET